jgi:hypothetical protein
MTQAKHRAPGMTPGKVKLMVVEFIDSNRN